MKRWWINSTQEAHTLTPSDLENMRVVLEEEANYIILWDEFGFSTKVRINDEEDK